MNRKQNSNDYIDLDQVYKFIEEEKRVEPNPFLANKIFASIENADSGYLRKSRNLRQNVLNPVLIGISVAAAISIGIIIGNLYKPVTYQGDTISDFVYMDDAAIESVNLLSND